MLLKSPELPPQAAQIRQRKASTGNDYIQIEQETKDTVYAFNLASYEVGFRYCEYCITAPLLFIAVLCLLTVDAPAWLYLSGYWMIQACIATGLAFHVTFCADMLRDAEKLLPGSSGGPPQSNETVADWFRSLLSNGSW
jgi:hypothetical protein